MSHAEKKNILFTDGSSLGNPGAGGWAAIIVIGGAQVVELGGREERTTNNRMELKGLIEGLRRLEKEEGELVIFCDSTYVIKGVTEWSQGWKKRGWITKAKTPVENRELWEELLDLVDKRKTLGKVTWEHVPGHIGIEGNERADEIATGFAGGEEVELYSGALEAYAVDVMNIAKDERRLRKRAVSRSRSKQKAYSYLSLVDGVVKKHKTWEECEKRVKGKSGVKYKKTLSPEDESVTLISWGVTPR